jgi:hypothetical protein
MTQRLRSPEATIAGLSLDYWLFWVGFAVSSLGSAFTGFALPLLIFKLTGSAVNLGLATAINYLPYPFLGLLVGAWVDRANRKLVLTITTLLNGMTIGSIPLMAAAGHLTLTWIYGALIVQATTRLFTTAAAAAAVPSLVPSNRLMYANGLTQATNSTMMVVGPLLAAGLAALLPLTSLMAVDALSYLFPVAGLMLVRRSFNLPREAGRDRQSLRADIAEGVKFIFHHPVLRNISLMMIAVNFFSLIVPTQLVFYAKVALHASNSQVGLLFAANALGVAVLALVAAPLRRHISVSRLLLGLLGLQGIITIVMAQIHIFWVVLPLAAAWNGLGAVFTINTTSLRQSLAPNHLLGRVVMTAGVMGASVVPLGALAGAFAIDRTGSISLVFSGIGVAILLLAVGFSFTALGQAERYLPAEVQSKRARALSA